MTSEDTTDAGSGSRACIRGSGRYAGTSCPGPDACLMTRSANLRAAYVAGCRSREATAANREKAATARAKNTEPRGVSADTWPVPSVKREPYGANCPQKDCGLPLYWEPGHAGLSCENRHWFNDPRIRNRIPVKSRAVSVAKPVDTVAEMKARSQFRMQRQRLIDECDELINGDFNPENYPPNNYYGSYAAQMRQQLLAMRPEFVSADTPEMLDAGRQLLAEFLAFVQNNLTGLKTAREIYYNKRQQQSLPATEEYEDDEEYEDEDEDAYEDSGESYREPERSIPRGSQSYGYLPAQNSPILSDAVLRFGMQARQAQLKREQNRTCYFTANHKGLFSRVPTATRQVWGIVRQRYANTPSKPISICDSERCRAHAEAHFLRGNWEFTTEKRLP